MGWATPRQGRKEGPPHRTLDGKMYKCDLSGYVRAGGCWGVRPEPGLPPSLLTLPRRLLPNLWRDSPKTLYTLYNNTSFCVRAWQGIIPTTLTPLAENKSQKVG